MVQGRGQLAAGQGFLKQLSFMAGKKQELICGTHPVAEAIEGGVQIMKLMVRRGLRSENISKILKVSREANIPVQEVPIEKLNRLAGNNHQGIVALISAVEFQPLEEIIPVIYERGETPFILMLDGITDVRNLGAVARSAECCGVHAMVIPEKGAAMPGKDAVKASAGALLRLPVCRVKKMLHCLDFLQKSGVQTVALTEKAEADISGCQLANPTALLMGSEGRGISPELLRKADRLAAIPMKGKIASLNISVAAGIAMYETLRQRREEEG